MTIHQPLQFRRAKIIADGLDIFLFFPQIIEENEYSKTITVSQDPFFKTEKKFFEAPTAEKDASVAATKGRFLSSRVKQNLF